MHDDFVELKSDMPFEDVLETIRENCKVVVGLQREIERLEKAEKEEVVVKPTTVCRAINSQLLSNEEKEEYSDDIGEEASYFIDTSVDLSDNPEELRNQLRSLLPPRTSGNYHRIMQRIRLNYIKSYNEYIRLVEEEKSSFTKQDIMMLMNEANHFLLAANILKELEYEEVLESEVQQEPNKIVFMTKGTGRAYIQDDLEKEKLTSEQLEEFAVLLDSIVNGSFTNVKRLAGSDTVRGISEVKGSGKRILFDRMGPNIYVVITGFVKKTDTSMGYREFLNNRLNLYRAYEEMIRTNCNDPVYLAEQELLLQEVYKTLGRNNISKDREVLL